TAHLSTTAWPWTGHTLFNPTRIGYSCGKGKCSFASAEFPMQVGIVGAGLIGRAWAVVFARAGVPTRLWDASNAALDEALATIRDRLGELQQVGLLEDAAKAWGCIQRCGSLAETVAGADFVQENLPESRDVKRTVFADLDRLAP